MQNDKQQFRYRIIFAIADRKKLLDAVLEFEKRGVWIQYIPCEFVVSRRVLDIATVLALRDLNRGKMVARKLNLQVALRYFGRTQVRDVIPLLETSRGSKFAIIIISEDPDTILDALCEWGVIISLLDDCIGDINRITEVFGISRDLFDRQKEGRKLGAVGLLERFVIERMATAFLMK